jgi:hypothetical protein
VTITDWVLVGRYAAGLDYPTNGSEFQRADCAPRSTLGDGAITVTDWVQAGRYAAGLDPLTVAGGPTSEITNGITTGNDAPPTDPPPGDSPREVQVLNTLLFGTQTSTVSVDLLAQGDENALGFSLSFDPSALVYTGAHLGGDATGSTLNVNAFQAAAGRLGFVLAEGFGSSFAAGTHEVVQVSFQAAGTNSGAYPVSLTDQPVRRQVSNPNASPLATTYVNGAITVNPRPSLILQRTGQSLTLAWPLWATNYVLEKAESLTPPAAWTILGDTPIRTNNQNLVTLPLSGTGGFFRLQAQ